MTGKNGTGFIPAPGIQGPFPEERTIQDRKTKKAHGEEEVGIEELIALDIN